MRKVLSALLVAAAAGVSAAPAAAIEGPTCMQNEITAGCTYCSYQDSRHAYSGQNCQRQLPGYDTKLCLLWYIDHCEYVAPEV